jgi:hypothetical protein
MTMPRAQDRICRVMTCRPSPIPRRHAPQIGVEGLPKTPAQLIARPLESQRKYRFCAIIRAVAVTELTRSAVALSLHGRLQIASPILRSPHPQHALGRSGDDIAMTERIAAA